ncbi:hypothetical protein WH367_22765 [Comamonas sp. MYb21]
MRKQLLQILACTVSLAPAHTLAQDAVVDAVVDHFLGQLAKRQGFTRLSTISNEGAKIGSIYGVVSPEVTCLPELKKQVLAGTPIQVQYLDDLPNVAARGGLVTGWTSVNISSVLGAGAEGAISAKLPERPKAEIKVALEALKSSQAQIIFGVLERPSLPLRSSGRKYLQDQAINNTADAGADVAGIIVPHAQLLLQKFEFNRASVQSADAGGGIKILDLIEAKIGAKAKRIESREFKLPTNAVFAFRAEPLIFNQECTNALSSQASKG